MGLVHIAVRPPGTWLEKTFELHASAIEADSYLRHQQPGKIRDRKALFFVHDRS